MGRDSGRIWGRWPRRAALVAGRAAAATALVAAALWAVSGLTGRGRPPGPRLRPWPARAGSPAAAQAAPAWAAAVLLPSGEWTFDAVPWGLGVRTLPREAAEAEVFKPPPAAAELTEPGSGSGGAELLALVRALRPERRAEDGRNAYLLTMAGVRAAVFTAQGPGGERVTCARAAYPGPDGGFLLIEAVPRPDAAAAASEASAGLLPLPGGARRVAVRSDGRGGVVAELAVAPGGADALRRHWERRGYRVEEAAARPGGAVALTCLRGRRAVSAWLWPRAGGGADTVVLQVRLPEDSGI